MKLLKSFILFVAFATLASCGGDDDAPVFELTTENFAGTYAVTKLRGTNKTSTTASGQTVDISTESYEGDTFQVDLVLSANGSFTYSGEYREVAVTKLNNGSAPVQETSIETENSSGTYTLDSLNRRVTFTDTNIGVINGIFEITSFSANTLVLSKEAEATDNQITTTEEITITFERQ
ncbi:hypothetical protein [Tenacibaculum jejuense]|uniref:Probable lipoprotein n=1 Tax=Tenacibaculum jejuense TaxID=584609 RepID=A0A238UHH1_9FLAO|nr:hypothetical protein [Tenacibaculum jejuense]SNR17760.1 Probable lipoprotein precursor [Tenacibaculum jejuense]